MIRRSTLGQNTKGERSNNAKIVNRLAVVDVIFIDEVSMLLCLDLLRIHIQLCNAFGMSDMPFAGKSIILAGDFAQLDPAGHGQYALYSGVVGGPRSGYTDAGQKNTLGKLL